MTKDPTPPTIKSPELKAADLCDKVKSDILRYGLEKALERWHVVCDYMQTQDWWPAVARQVEAVFDNAFEERARLQREERQRQQEERQQIAPVNINVAQMQANKAQKTDNTFQAESKCQVFNDDANGNFINGNNNGTRDETR